MAIDRNPHPADTEEGETAVGVTHFPKLATRSIMSIDPQPCTRRPPVVPLDCGDPRV